MADPARSRSSTRSSGSPPASSAAARDQVATGSPWAVISRWSTGEGPGSISSSPSSRASAGGAPDLLLGVLLGAPRGLLGPLLALGGPLLGGRRPLP
ncbi:hypothetical protein ACFU98_16105 [Streptomyces sp. NPDC057575]|uniref:hypothetical protein n=1 Tax=unclassified Streptomyces TaxID=2593676 RepID=UPI003694ED60